MATSLQPALIIGLGGSGIEIVRRFRRRLQRDYPQATHVRFLGVDTDPQVQERPESPKLPDDEFHHAGNFDMAQFVSDRAIPNFPVIRDWWRGYGSLPFAFVAAGAGMRRPVGRLALFVHFDDVKAAIERQLRAIFQTDSFNALRPEYRKQVTVYIVASTCGGTGTGMFLDMAYVARQLVPEAMPGVMPKVRGLLLLPSAFIGTRRVPAGAHTSLRANSYGALAELDYCMSKSVRRAPVLFPTRMGPWTVGRDDLAFRSCFLLGNQDAEGAVYTRWDDLVERGSAHLHVTLASPLAQAGNSWLDNVESWMGALPAVQGRSPLYSSLNADEIELPSARVHARWAKRFAAQLIARLEGVGTSGGRGPAGDALRELESAPGYGWLHRALTPTGVRELVPALPDYKAQLQRVTPDRVDVERMVSDAGVMQAEAARQIDRLRVEERVAQATAEARTEIDAAVSRTVAAGSLEDAIRLLRELRERLDAMSERVQDKRRQGPLDWVADFAARARAMKKGVLQSKDAFAQAVAGTAAQACGDAELAWERALWVALGQTLGDATNLPLLRSHLERRREQLERLRALLPSARTRVERLEEPALAPGMDAAISDAEMDAAFDDPDRQERLTVFAREHLGALLGEGVLTADTTADVLVDVARRAAQLVAADFVAGTQIRPERIAERLDRLQPLAVYTTEWNALTLGGSVERPQRVALLGLPERMTAQDESIRRLLQVPNRETTTAPIADEDRVLMMAQHHGFPLFALAELAECRRAFEADPASRELRFSLPEAEARRWTIEPLGASASNQWFAVALALGRVKRDPIISGYVYVEGSNGNATEHVLCQGERHADRAREQARDEFLRRGLADSFQHALRREATTAPQDGGLYDRLKAWVDAEGARAADPEYPSSFRADLDEVREYARSIRF